MFTDLQRIIMHEHLDAAAIRSKEEIEWLLKVEKSPATLNMRYCIDCKNTIGQVDRTLISLRRCGYLPRRIFMMRSLRFRDLGSVHRVTTSTSYSH